MVRSVLVVCIGNICRSPMAQALLTDALPRLRVLSAGTNALIGQPAEVNAQQLIAARGLSIAEHRAQQVTGVLCTQAEIILVMDQQQRWQLESRYPPIKGRVFRIGEFTRHDVPDPYGQSREKFEHALALLEAGVNAWVQRINRL